MARINMIRRRRALLLKSQRLQRPRLALIDDSDCKAFRVPKIRPRLLRLIKHETPPGVPIVGLSEIRELVIKQTNYCLYDCLTCGSWHSTLDILDHLRSSYHRIKYLDLIDDPDLWLVYGNPPELAEEVAHLLCRDVQASEGMGRPEVIKKIYLKSG